jgi:hypothetical protein
MTLIPTQVTFRGLDVSDALEEEIRERVTWLEQFYRGHRAMPRRPRQTT